MTRALLLSIFTALPAWACDLPPSRLYALRNPVTPEYALALSGLRDAPLYGAPVSIPSGPAGAPLSTPLPGALWLLLAALLALVWRPR